MNSPSAHEKLAQDLMDGTATAFFNYAQQESVIDSIWQVASNRPLLLEVVADPALPGQARFLAAEILFAREFTFLTQVDPEEVAGIYVQALLHNYTGMANSWGFLYESQDAGPVGIRFDMIGKSAIPALLPLLDHSAPGPPYAGSKEATVGNEYHFRIKDFAAFYLGKLIGMEMQYFSGFEERDQQIQALRDRL